MDVFNAHLQSLHAEEAKKTEWLNAILKQWENEDVYNHKVKNHNYFWVPVHAILVGKEEKK